ncbi:hypothetical protein [Kytococcus sedentarius]|uniref:hypothetical protein n=1 Tax=Kytococcus sedentarius TaxID=1276 RepID=UPI00195060CA|nr:hypothetical protein [Kytococcus sedentarius]QRO86906.1 hypothetical protein I6J30_08640 [Kytococcus sedentarius]
MRHTVRLSAFAFAVLLGVSACGGDELSTEDKTSSTSTTSEGVSGEVKESKEASSEDSSSEEAADESPADAQESDEGGALEGEAEWGQTASNEQIAVTLEKPKAFKPSDTSFGSEGFESAVRQKVTIENKGDKPIDPISIYFTATTGDVAAEQIFDSGNGIGSPDAKIRPGKKLTFDIGWAVNKGEELAVTLDYTDDETFDQTSATWVGTP